MATSLAGKWIIITGASSGFGASATRAFGVQGAKILIGARRLARLKVVAAEADEAGASEVHFHALDVSKTSSVNAFAKWAKKIIGTAPIDVLINNAGGAHGVDTVAEGKDHDWETMFQTNVLGILRMTRAVLPLMTNNLGASIINIGSYASRVAYEGGAAYCAAKAGEAQISRTLRLELSGTGIRVCSVDPGLAETEFSLVRFKGDKAKASKPYEGTIPLVAEDVAEILVWVASRPSHVNIDEMLIKPTDQASITKVYRRKK